MQAKIRHQGIDTRENGILHRHISPRSRQKTAAFGEMRVVNQFGILDFWYVHFDINKNPVQFDRVGAACAHIDTLRYSVRVMDAALKKPVLIWEDEKD